jgi:hypothetical protein
VKWTSFTAREGTLELVEELSFGHTTGLNTTPERLVDGTRLPEEAEELLLSHRSMVVDDGFEARGCFGELPEAIVIPTFRCLFHER